MSTAKGAAVRAKTLATPRLDVKNRKNDCNSRNDSTSRESWEHQGTPNNNRWKWNVSNRMSIHWQQQGRQKRLQTLTPGKTSTAVWTAAIAVIIATPRIPETSTTVRNIKSSRTARAQARTGASGTPSTAGMLPTVGTPETAGTSTTVGIRTGSKECQWQAITSVTAESTATAEATGASRTATLAGPLATAVLLAAVGTPKEQDHKQFFTSGGLKCFPSKKLY